MQYQEDRRYLQAVSYLCQPLQELLLRAPLSLQEWIQEIRIRAGAPLSVWTGRESLFYTSQGFAPSPDMSGRLVSRGDLESSFQSLCGYSVHSHQ